MQSRTWFALCASVAAGCAADSLSESASRLDGRSLLVFRIPDPQAAQLVVQLERGEPIAANRDAGELSLTAEIAGEGEAGIIETRDIEGAVIGTAKVFVRAPRDGDWSSEQFKLDDSSIATVSNYRVQLVREDAEGQPNPIALRAQFLRPDGDRIDVEDVEWNADRDDARLTPDRRDQLLVSIADLPDPVVIETCANHRVLCGITVVANHAGVVRRTGWISTDLELGAVSGGDHTIVMRFMAQYPRSSEGTLFTNLVNGTNEYSVGIGNDSGAGKEIVLRIRLQGTTSDFLIQNWERTANTEDWWLNPAYKYAAPTPTTNRWHHLAVVRSGIYLYPYVDGQALSVMPGSAVPMFQPTTPPSGQLVIGTRALAWEHAVQFYGLVDDLAMFTGAKTPNEIMQLVAQPTLTGFESQLVRAVLFDGATTSPVIGQPKFNGESYSHSVSANRDAVADQAVLPLPFQVSTFQLPFPSLHVFAVTQEFDTEHSHRDGAAFSWDLIRVGTQYVQQSLGQPTVGPFLDDSFSEGERVSATTSAIVRQTFVKSNGSNVVLYESTASPQNARELVWQEHLRSNANRVLPGSTVTSDTVITQAGNTGINQYTGKTVDPHLHISFDDSECQNPGLPWEYCGITFPAAFSDYDVSRDYGSTWTHVVRGMPRVGEWIRRSSAGGRSDLWCPSQNAQFFHCLD